MFINHLDGNEKSALIKFINDPKLSKGVKFQKRWIYKMNNGISQLVFVKRVAVNEMGFAIDNGREAPLGVDGKDPGFKPGSCY